MEAVFQIFNLSEDALCNHIISTYHWWGHFPTNCQ